MIKFQFPFEEKPNWRSEAIRCYKLIKILLAGKQEFQIEIKELVKEKSSNQVKGFHRLCDLIAPYVSKEWGEIFDGERVKYYLKTSVGFCSYPKGVPVVKSIRDASMDDMNKLIEAAIELGAMLNVPNCCLTSREKQEMIKFYETKSESRKNI